MVKEFFNTLNSLPNKIKAPISTKQQFEKVLCHYLGKKDGTLGKLSDRDVLLGTQRMENWVSDPEILRYDLQQLNNVRRGKRKRIRRKV